MGETVFKGVEIVGTSDQSFSHAIEVAVRRAREPERRLHPRDLRDGALARREGCTLYMALLAAFLFLAASP